VELLSYMRLFVEVARAKSFRRAADALDMPNSTLSRYIAELEKTMGLRLLHRSTRKVELTEAGEVYFKRCQSVVEEARIAHESLLDMVERPTGTLRVSMPADLATDHLAPIIADFAKMYPLIAFEFDLSPRQVDLQTEPFDLAIRIGPPPMGAADARRAADRGVAAVSVRLSGVSEERCAANAPQRSHQTRGVHRRGGDEVG